jgi:hypothetical protein
MTTWTTTAFVALPVGWVSRYSGYTEACPGVLVQKAGTATRVAYADMNLRPAEVNFERLSWLG